MHLFCDSTVLKPPLKCDKHVLNVLAVGTVVDYTPAKASGETYGVSVNSTPRKAIN